MAISSSLSSSTLFHLCNSTSISPKQQPKIPITFSYFPNVSKQQQQLQPQSYRLSTTRVFTAPEVLDSAVSVSDVVAPLELSDESIDFFDPEVQGIEVPERGQVQGIEVPERGQLQPKLIIRIKLRSYFVPLIEDSCKRILDAARNTNAKVNGPIPLPTKKRIYCGLKSPHVHKDARFHFEIRTHSRVIDILYPTADTIDALQLLDLPPAVDIQLTY